MKCRRSVWMILLALTIVCSTGLAANGATRSSLLTNGDFEGGFTVASGFTGTVAGDWTPFVLTGGAGPTFGPGAGVSGYGQSITSVEPFAAGIYQQVSGLEVGRKYRAGVDAYPLPGQDGVVKLVGVDLFGGTNPAGGFIAWSSAHAADTWAHLTITFTAVSDSATIFLKAHRAGGSGAATVTFDNAYLTRFYAQTLFLPLISKSQPLPTATASPSHTPTPTRTGTPTHTLPPTETQTITPTATPTATRSTTPTGECSPQNLCWDDRLDELNVTVEQDAGKRYQLIAAFRTFYGSWDDVPAWARQWQDDTLGGDTHAYGLCLDAGGNVVENKLFELSWNGDSAPFVAEPNGWANAFLGGPGSTYYPDQGEKGPFSWNPRNGNKLQGLGLPYNLHYSFFGVWQEADLLATPTASPTQLGTATPTATGATMTPTPTPSATAPTPTPTATGPGHPIWQYQADGIIVGQPNCSQTSLGGTIFDEGGLPLAGVRVKAWAPEWGEATSAPSDGSGQWNIHVASSPFAAHWQLAVVNEAGQIISPIAGQQYVPQIGGEIAGIPTSGNCTDGHQRLTINWKACSTWTDFVAASVRFLSCEENHMNHNIYNWVLDSEGNGINNVWLRFYLPSSYTDSRTGIDTYKPAGYLDFPMFAHDERRVEVRDYSSDLVEGISNITPPIIDACGGNAWGHYSYQVVFQASRDLTLMTKRTKLPVRITPVSRLPLLRDLEGVSDGME